MTFKYKNFRLITETKKHLHTDLGLLTTKPKQIVQEWLNKFETFLFDCDGVLWIGDSIIEGSPEVINKLIKIGKRVLFVTNNSTKSRNEFAKKARKMKFNVTADNIITSSFLVRDYLTQINFKKTVYIIGQDGIADELKEGRIKSFGVGRDYQHFLSLFEHFRPDPDVGAVVVGFDSLFSYTKLVKAGIYLNNPDCLFIASNSDERFPKIGKIRPPAAGMILVSVATLSSRKPTILGKPHDFLQKTITNTYKVDPETALMIGDRLNTDILWGKKCGFATLLVLSGVTSKIDIEKLKKSQNEEDQMMIPNEYAEKLGDILPFL